MSIYNDTFTKLQSWQIIHSTPCINRNDPILGTDVGWWSLLLDPKVRYGSCLAQKMQNIRHDVDFESFKFHSKRIILKLAKLIVLKTVSHEAKLPVVLRRIDVTDQPVQSLVTSCTSLYECHCQDVD